jgi:hypothetical protein
MAHITTYSPSCPLNLLNAHCQHVCSLWLCKYIMMDAPRYLAIRDGYMKDAWSALPSMAMTSEKSRMVIMPCSAPITAVVP